jgi:hypothetical protein
MAIAMARGRFGEEVSRPRYTPTDRMLLAVLAKPPQSIEDFTGREGELALAEDAGQGRASQQIRTWARMRCSRRWNTGRRRPNVGAATAGLSIVDNLLPC